MPTDEQVADDLRAVRANLAEAEEAARVAKMSETVEVSLVRCAELVALGLAIAEGRVQAVRETISNTGAECIAAGRWADAEDLTHWGACADHIEKHIRKAAPTELSRIAHWANKIADEHAEAGEDEAAREWRAIAAALKEADSDE